MCNTLRGHSISPLYYDAAGQVGRITDVNGRSEDLAYDGRGRVTAVTHVADGSSKSVAYNLAGDPVTITDQDGITTNYEYDPVSGRLTKILDVDGNYIAHAYDAQGNRVETAKYTAQDVRKSRKRWNYQHPVLPGRLYRTIKYNDAYAEYTYDANGNPTAYRDFNGNITGTAYDPFNRVETVTEPGTNGVTAHGYDLQGNLTSVTDAEGQATVYTYDDMGRVLSVDSPDSGLTRYRYDTAGNLVWKTNALNVTVVYDYDDLNRLTAENFPDTAENAVYTYDAGANGKGRLSAIADPSGTVAFGYDNRGRLYARTSTVSSVAYVVSRSFTAAGRIDSFVYPTGRSIDFTHGADGKITAAESNLNGHKSILFSDMAFNPFGAPSEYVSRAGSSVSAQSSDCGCLEVANPGTRMEQVYSYDDNGNVINVAWTNLPAYDQTYQYDALDRLTGADNFIGTFNYTYDKVGNRQTRTIGNQVETYNYVPDTNQLASITGYAPVVFGRDAAGNTTDIGAMDLIYNQRGRMIRVEENSEILGEYTYNALGQRISNTVDAATTVFHYGFNGDLIGESAPDGTFGREYIYLFGKRFARVDSVSRRMYFYHNDHLGTPVLMTDVYDALVWEGNATPFGDTEVSPASLIENNFRFVGQYYDAETGLHYNYHRYYDPSLGRYLRADPIGLAGGINIYVYVINSPNNIVDPLGLKGIGTAYGGGFTAFGIRFSIHYEQRIIKDSSKSFFDPEAWSGAFSLTYSYGNQWDNECGNKDEDWALYAGADYGLDVLLTNADNISQVIGYGKTIIGGTAGVGKIGGDFELSVLTNKDGLALTGYDGQPLGELSVSLPLPRVPSGAYGFEVHGNTKSRTISHSKLMFGARK